ncbi:MAG: hypothetical protein SPI35_06745 [Porphyromonas sp.]|nr:hypothetical protein [Porphyromonas sp.]
MTENSNKKTTLLLTVLSALFWGATVAMVAVFFALRNTAPWAFLILAFIAIVARVAYYVVRYKQKR